MSHRKKFFTTIISLILAGIFLIIQGLQLENVTQPVDPITPTPSLEVTSEALGIEGQKAAVTRVVDGDTVDVSIDGQQFKVRYIGIDTPETVDPRRGVGCFGKEASLENKRLVEGREIILVKDISETDRFGRLVRYVYLKTDGQLIFVNDYLVRNGFAKASTFPPDVKFADQFREAEIEARENNRGLWQKCQ